MAKKQWVKPEMKRFDVRTVAAVVVPELLETMPAASEPVEQAPIDAVGMIRAEFLEQEREQVLQPRCA